MLIVIYCFWLVKLTHLVPAKILVNKALRSKTLESVNSVNLPYNADWSCKFLDVAITFCISFKYKPKLPITQPIAPSM